MRRYFKFFEYAYLVIAVIFLIETYTTFKTNPKQAYLYMAFSALAVFMYFFRKKTRKKYEDQDKK